MSELLLVIKIFSENNPEVVTWGIAGIVLLFGIMLQMTEIKEYIAKWSLTHFLKNIGNDVLHNVSIPDGMDGHIVVDFLILMPKKIILLGVKNYRGLIFAAEKIDFWTQVIGNKSYKFNNPLVQLENDALALKSKVENIAIEEKVLFIKGSEFPKGKPESVVSIDDVKIWKKEATHDAPSALIMGAWAELSALAVSNVHTTGVLFDGENTTGLNVSSFVAMIVALFLWLTWRLAY